MNRKALMLQDAESEGPGILADLLDARAWSKDVIYLYLGEPTTSNWKYYGLLVAWEAP